MILDKISDRLLLAGVFFTITFFATKGMLAEDLLPSLTPFQAGGAQVPTRSRRLARPLELPPAAATVPAPVAAPRVLVDLATVLFAECFKTSQTAFRGLFLPELLFAKSEKNDETKFLPIF